MQIPYHKPYWTGMELEYIEDALRRQVSGNGYYTGMAAEIVREMTGACRVLPTTSGTHALEMAVMLCGLQEGDEVILPSFTFPSTANAVILRGARPVFAEINDTTLTLDPGDVGRRITGRTRAIIPVHYGGIGCDMEGIMELARCHNLYVIEDAAQAVDARYRGKPLGTWGHLGCFSFHGTKNHTSGEGGALLINTSDRSWFEEAEIIWEKGTDRAKFLRGEKSFYTWVGPGSNYTPSEVLMAMLCAQLRERDLIREQRRLIHEYYESGLAEYRRKGLLQMTEIPSHCQSNYHIFYLLLPSPEAREEARRGLIRRGISALSHFVPLHSSPMGQKLGLDREELPVTERVSRCILRLPLYAGMTGEESLYVLENLRDVLEQVL